MSIALKLTAFALLGLSGLSVLVVLYRTLTFEPPISASAPAPQQRNNASASIVLPPVEVLAEKLARLVRIPSVSNNRTTPEWIATLDASLAAQFPLTYAHLERTEFPRGRLFRWKGASNSSSAPVLLLAHADVVPATEEDVPARIDEATAPFKSSLWKYPPFSGEIHDESVWGRGTMDCKQTIVSILSAIEALWSSGFTPQQDIIVAIGLDEEIGGLQGAVPMAAHIAGLYPNTQLAFVLDEGAVVTAAMVPGIDAKVALIGTAEKVYADVELYVHSDGGHASMPSTGLSTHLLAAALTRLAESPMEAHLSGPSLDMFLSLAPEMGFMEKLLFSNLWFSKGLVVGGLEKNPTTNALLRTTLATTILRAGNKSNALPRSATAILNVRIHPMDDKKTVMRYIRNTINDARVKVRFVGEESDLSEAAHAQPKTPSVRKTSSQSTAPKIGKVPPRTFHKGPAFMMLSQSIRRTFGYEGSADEDLLIVPALLVATTDARHYVHLSPSVFRFSPQTVYPRDRIRFHGVNERLRLSDLKKGTRFYVELLSMSTGKHSPNDGTPSR